MAKKMIMEDVDRISDLPNPILSDILSLLSTKEAVRTSILSTRWRYLFVLVSNLDLDLDERTSDGKRLKIKSLKRFVEKRLCSDNMTRVDKFGLKCRKRVDSNYFNRWISGAVSRGVKHLDLNISLSKFTLPSVVLTCRTLVALKLDIHFVLNVPSDVCFPNLKTLHLKPRKLSNGDSVTSLVSSCISLEDLVMENCTMKSINIYHSLLKRLTILSSIHSSSIVINTPALICFKYSGRVAGEYSLMNLQSLVEAEIYFLNIIKDLDNFDPLTANSFLTAISTVQSLNLSFTSLKLLNRRDPLPTFPKLVHLKICDDSEVYFTFQRGLANLLMNSYELEELEFYQEVLTDLPEEVPPCMLYKLRVIKISNFRARVDCIGKAKYFLENARVLKQLTIRTSLFISQEEKLKITYELWKSPRRSKQCCISIF